MYNESFVTTPVTNFPYCCYVINMVTNIITKLQSHTRD